VIEDWIHWMLICDPRTAAWFGFRVFPVIGEQEPLRDAAGNVLPFVTFRLAGSQPEFPLDLQTMTGTANVVVEAFATSYEDAKAASRAVTAVIGRATKSGWGSRVHVSLASGESDDAGVPVNGKDKPLYTVSMTFSILFED
jgi:hypothetical protein